MKRYLIRFSIAISILLPACASHLGGFRPVPGTFRESKGFSNSPIDTSSGTYRATYFDYKIGITEEAANEKAGNGFLHSEGFAGRSEVYTPSGHTADDATITLFDVNGKRQGSYPFRVGTVLLLTDPQSEPVYLVRGWKPKKGATRPMILSDFRELIESREKKGPQKDQEPGKRAGPSHR